MNYNRIIIAGRIASDIEKRTTNSGKAVVNLRIATNEVYKDSIGEKQEKSNFFKCVMWGRLAEICEQYMMTGQEILVDGKLENRQWENSEGQKVTTVEIVVENMQMGNRPKNASAAKEIAGKIDENVSKREQKDDSIAIEDIPF